MEDQSIIISNKFVTIKDSFNGVPKEADFELVTRSITMDSQSWNRVVVKCLLVSIDPSQLNRMKIQSPSHDYNLMSSRLLPGEIIDAYGVGKVIDSKDPRFQKDDLVVGILSWAQYTVVENAQYLQRLDSTEFPLSYHLGVLGFSGLTAYAGLFKVGKLKKGDKIFVSAASGSVGSLVGQYAKLFGCYVVGCAGTTKKVALLKEKLGFDDAFNYKEEDNLNLVLKRYFPEGIDIYFDNVGGEMQEAAIANMNNFGRVIVCGAIAEYCDPAKRMIASNMINIIYKRITIQGFLSNDYRSDEKFYADFLSTTSSYIRTGQLLVLEDISKGLENIPSAFISLFNGRNIGKTIVQVQED